MQRFDQVYFGGSFRRAHGREELILLNPTTEEPSGVLVMADEEDARQAVDSAQSAFAGWSQSSRKERIELLNSLSEAVRARADELTEATIIEYGGPIEQAKWRAGLAANNFRAAARLLEDFVFSRWINDTEVVAQAAGVAVHIVP